MRITCVSHAYLMRAAERHPKTNDPLCVCISHHMHATCTSHACHMYVTCVSHACHMRITSHRSTSQQITAHHSTSQDITSHHITCTSEKREKKKQNNKKKKQRNEKQTNTHTHTHTHTCANPQTLARRQFEGHRGVAPLRLIAVSEIHGQRIRRRHGHTPPHRSGETWVSTPLTIESG